MVSITKKNEKEKGTSRQKYQWIVEKRMETETICKGKRRKTCKKVGNGEKKDKENFHLFFVRPKPRKGISSGDGFQPAPAVVQ